ncbi:MAG TPA: hypothetical protein VN611_15405 [Patescibacteria group bacterium]|nr:hypothetical protein [Patescibacteria group bacterium]
MPGFPQLVNDYTRLFKSNGDQAATVPASRAGDGREYEADTSHGHNSKTREDQ